MLIILWMFLYLPNPILFYLMLNLKTRKMHFVLKCVTHLLCIYPLHSFNYIICYWWKWFVLENIFIIILGEGHYAVVKLARHVFTGEKVAVKVIDKQRLDQSTRLQMLQEVKLMKLVQHPNVVRLYEVRIADLFFAHFSSQLGILKIFCF